MSKEISMNVNVGDRVQVARPGKARTVTRTVRAIDGDALVTDKGERLPLAGVTFNYTSGRDPRH